MKGIVLAFCLGIVVHAQSQTSYTWKGTISSAWDVAGNWLPSGVPGPADNVTIVTGGNICVLPAATSINNLTVTSGVLDLGGLQLTVSGATASFGGGTVQNGRLWMKDVGNTNFGSGATTLNCKVYINSSTVNVRNATFQDSLVLTKTGTSNDASAGGNVFNGPVVMTNTGAGYLLMGNGSADHFNASAQFTDSGSANLYVAYNSSNNVFAGPVTFNSYSSVNGGIFVSSYSAGTSFGGNITVNSNAGLGVQFCTGNSTATAALAAGMTLTVGAGGFSAGSLVLRQFTQAGATAQNFLLTGTASLYFGPSSSFDGNIVSSSPGLLLNGCTFNGSTDLTKTGSSGDWGQGGNVYNGVCSITNSGSNYLLMGSTNPDIWNSDVTFTDNGSERLLPGWGSTGNQFNGNIYINTSGSATGVQFCGGNTTATAVLATGKTIQAGSGGITAGYLYLKQFTQVGATPVTLTGSGSSSIYLGPSSSFDAAVTVTAPNIWAQGATYNSPVVFTKTGGGNNHNNQYPNVFNASCTINQQSSGGYFMLGYNSNDLFNDNIIVSSTGTGGILLGYTSGTGTPTMAAGRTISVGAAGFSSGYLQLNTFTQLGNAPMNFAFTGTNTSITFARGSVIGGDVTVTSPDILLSGCTFNGALTATKTGAGGDWGQGGNVFNGVCNLTNSGAGYFLLGGTNPDTWNNDVTFTDNGTERLLPCYYSTGNQFNGNIYVNTAGSATGIQFCGGNTTATASLAAGMTIQAGSGGLTAGYLYLKQFSQAGSAPITLTATGTSSVYLGPSSNFGGAVTVTAPNIWAQGATYASPVVFTKTGGGSNHNNQYQNIFNGTCTINQQSSGGYFMLGYNSNDLFNDDIILTSTGTGGIYLGWVSGTGTPTLAAGKTISVGAAGFSSGYLQFNTFTQLGNAPINLLFTGTNTSMTFARASVFGGDVTVSTPDIYLNGATFNGQFNATKTGANGDYSQGGNVFNGLTLLTNSGSGYFLLGNTSPDTWNNDVIFADNGSERLLPCWGSAGNQFNGNIFVSTGGSAQGIQFCGGNGTATATLAAGKTIQAGAAGLNAGYLILRQFTSLGTAAINLTLASTATYLQYGPASSFAGNVTSSSPGLYFNGSTFGGTVNCIKTGASSDASVGNNVFNGVTTLTNNGAGNFFMGNGNLDQFNADATFINTGGANIYVAYNSVNNVFGGTTTFVNLPTGNTGIYVSHYSAGTSFTGNIVVNSSGGQGVQFCAGNSTATATLAGGRTIAVGSAGFSGGTLLLRHFTQTGATAQNLVLTGNGNLTIGPSSSFDGDVTGSSPALYLNGATFNGISNFSKTGATGDQSQGGNVFNGVSSVTNSGSGYLLLGASLPDIWNNDVTFTDNGSERLLPGWSTTGNQFNGNVYVNTSGSATGIQFCGGNNTATALLAAGKTILAGGVGLNAGYLQLRQIIQAGSAPINLTVASTGSYIQYGPLSTFGGNIVSSSPGLYFVSSTFNGSVNCTKTGNSNDNSAGGNIFNGALTLTNNGSGYLLLANTAGDAYNNSVRLVKSSSGLIYPNYNAPCTYAGNLSVSSASTITFGSAVNGVASFTGSGAQSIGTDPGTPAPVFTRFVIANTGSGVTLNNPVNVSSVMTLTSGLLNTSTAGLLTLLNGANTAAGTALSTSYVNGPMCFQKSTSGVTTLNFPVGSSPDCRPVVLTVNHSNGTLYNYTVQVYNIAPATLGYTLPPTITSLPTSHYYTISRTNAAGTSQPNQNLNGNQTVQVFFGANDNIVDGTGISVVKNTYTATTAWIDIGGTGGPSYSGGTNLTGSVTSTSAPSSFNSFSTFALGINHFYLLPTKLLYFKAQPDGGKVDLSWSTSMEANCSGFTVEKSRDGAAFAPLTWVASQADGGNSSVPLDYSAVDPSPYTGVTYYRLAQTDRDGKVNYSQVVTVHFDVAAAISVYPNPSRGTLWISGLEGSLSTVAVTLYDLGGKPVLETNAAVQGGMVRLDTRLNNGVYVLRLQYTGGAPVVRNIVILR
ncbi:MAG TPA: T9SS type A sorting domain-containing protein [Puia sp.]|uniref:T9SS type A sorting domain-containing protein n=1 Tax=Puia sp. TaxID=2045100 RepID=UPI002C471B81|nr:T9SS type A sorting domain-containing protein [Puia sp.]HVU95213.1 T9SS type A sorting domain-containing protein [Puia sp.]